MLVKQGCRETLEHNDLVVLIYSIHFPAVMQITKEYFGLILLPFKRLNRTLSIVCFLLALHFRVK